MTFLYPRFLCYFQIKVKNYRFDGFNEYFAVAWSLMTSPVLSDASARLISRLATGFGATV